jgi:hypothetical protein
MRRFSLAQRIRKVGSPATSLSCRVDPHSLADPPSKKFPTTGKAKAFFDTNPPKETLTIEKWS